MKLAPTIGIAVDHRRHNRSLESLQVWSRMALVGSKRWKLSACVGAGEGWGQSCMACTDMRLAHRKMLHA